MQPALQLRSAHVGPSMPMTRLYYLPCELKREGKQYVITLNGLDSEDRGQEYVGRLWAGLAWVLLNKFIGFTAELQQGDIIYAKNPDIAAENLSKSFGTHNRGPVHDMGSCGTKPVIYPSDKKICFGYASGDFKITYTGNDFLSLLVQGASAPNSAGIREDERLSTGFDLYNAYYYETSQRARLLTLVLALESLATEKQKHPTVQAFMNAWREALIKKISSLDQGTEEYEDFCSLERELSFRRGSSFRSNIRRLVTKTLEADKHEETEAFALEAVKVYDLRSKLAHEGALPVDQLNAGVEKALKIVNAVLKAKFKAVTGLIA